MMCIRLIKCRAFMSDKPSSLNDGFTLTEMLVTLLIMVLASTLLATGVPVAIDTYTKTVTSANAQMALSSTITALRGELGSCEKLFVSGNEVYYLSQEGFWINVANSNGSSVSRGLIKRYYASNDTATAPVLDGDKTPLAEYPLIPDSVLRGAKDNLYVSRGDIAAEQANPTDSIVIASISVEDSSGNRYASVSPYKILARFARPN